MEASRDLEPLEAALQSREGPEARQSTQCEAPDAGRGENVHDHESFTLGRSWS
jgi:hypothetical protein